MDDRCFIPANAVKPTFTTPPDLVTMSPLPQAVTTGASIFEQPPNATAQAKQEIGQLQLIQNICTLCTPVGRKCPDNVLTQNCPEWSEPEAEDWDGEKQKEKENKEEESKDSEQKELKQKCKTDYPSNSQYTPNFTQVPTEIV